MGLDNTVLTRCAAGKRMPETRAALGRLLAFPALLLLNSEKLTDARARVAVSG